MTIQGRPKHTTGQASILSEQHQKTFFTYLNGIRNPYLRDRNILIMTLNFKLGLRAKELASLNLGDVINSTGEVRDILRLTSEKTKGERHRDIPLTNKQVRLAIQVFITHHWLKETHSALFKTQRLNRFTPNSMQQRIGRLLREAGFDGKYSSHTGRRSFITTLAQRGFDLNSIRELAGHSSLATTQRYIQNDPERLAKMLQAL